MNTKTENRTSPSDYSAYRYCIFAVHANDKGVYWYEPEHKMFFRGFYSRKSREDYWQTVIEQQSVARPRRAYELALFDVRGRTRVECEKVGDVRYAESPIIDVGIDHRDILVGLVNCTPRVR